MLVVLGGGGLKGLAHVGAWQAIEEVGVKVAGIVGTSIGALIGAMITSGVRWRELVPLVFALRKQDIARINRRVVLINGIRQEALFQGEPLKAYIVRTLPVTQWEELLMSFQINAVDLETGLTDWFGPGASTDAAI